MSVSLSAPIDPLLVHQAYFHAYPHFDNLNRKHALKLLSDPELSKLEWCASEKIDGCNASLFHVVEEDDGTIRSFAASRNQVLDNEDSTKPKDRKQTLFTMDAIRIRYLSSLADLFKLCKAAESIQVYGELYGGYFPGVAKGVKAIQNRVIYSPVHKYRVFDILVDETTFLGREQVVALCTEVGLPYVHILHRGTMQEMFALNPVFLSTIPVLDDDVSLEEVAKLTTNYAEGYMLRPLKSQVMDLSKHVVVKLKNPSFTEKEQDGKKATPFVCPTGVVPLDEKVIASVSELINTNRYASVLSKLTEQQRVNKGVVIKAMGSDVIQELDQDVCDWSVPKNYSVVMKLCASFVLQQFA